MRRTWHLFALQWSQTQRFMRAKTSSVLSWINHRLTLVVNSIQCIIVYYYYYHHHYHHHDYYYSLLLLLLLLFLKPTSTKPQAENIDVLNKVNGCNDVSFGDHGVLEGDRIPPLLKSHGQALEEELCFPQWQPSCTCQSPALFLLFFMPTRTKPQAWKLKLSKWEMIATALSFVNTFSSDSVRFLSRLRRRGMNCQEWMKVCNELPDWLCNVETVDAFKAALKHFCSEWPTRLPLSPPRPRAPLYA